VIILISQLLLNNMFFNKYKNLTKLFLAFIFAYLLSSFSIKNVFLANSPRVRPNLDQYLLAKINNTKDNILAKFNFNFLPSFNWPNPPNIALNTSSQNRDEVINFLKNNLKPITKGVNAAKKDNYIYTEFTMSEIEWIQITYTLKNGQTMTIEYPKGTSPPPKEIYEN